MSKTVSMVGGEQECRVVRMCSNLRDHQFKIILYTYYYLMVTTNQKGILDTHTKRRKESKDSTKDGHQITEEENKRRK